MLLWACSASPQTILSTPSSVVIFASSPVIAASSSTPSPTSTLTAIPMPSPEVRDPISIWKSYIGVQGQKDHLIFYVVTENTSMRPLSIRILDPDTGQATNSFPLTTSSIPNLCTAQSIKGKSYFQTTEVFFEDLPQDFWERLMSATFTYLVELEEGTGERLSIAIIEPPGNCMNLVQ